MEFRAYIKDNQMVGLQQKDETAYYEQIADTEFKALVFGKVAELTEKLKEFDSKDPVKYDFAIYRIGQEKILDK